MRTCWSFYGTIPTALFNHLTAQVAGDVRDMYPPPVALPNQLGKLDAPLLILMRLPWVQELQTIVFT